MINDDLYKCKREYREAVKYYNEYYSISDRILYNLCKKYPYHKNKREIAAKVGIIGRSYAAGLERHSKKDLDGIIDFFYGNRKAIGNVIRTIKLIHEPLTELKLRKIIFQHGIFLKILKKLTAQTSVRSFSSKYMHFHCPVVPIYDSVVSKEIRRLYPLTNKKINRFPNPKNGDDEYHAFCVRFLALYNDLREIKLKVDVKKVDRYLYSLGD